MLRKYKTMSFFFFFKLKILLPDVSICKAMEIQQSFENAQD